MPSSQGIICSKLLKQGTEESFPPGMSLINTNFLLNIFIFILNLVLREGLESVGLCSRDRLWQHKLPLPCPAKVLQFRLGRISCTGEQFNLLFSPWPLLWDHGGGRGDSFTNVEVYSPGSGKPHFT